MVKGTILFPDCFLEAIKTEVNAHCYCYIIPRIIAHVCGKQFQLSCRASVGSVPIHRICIPNACLSQSDEKVCGNSKKVCFDNDFCYSVPLMLQTHAITVQYNTGGVGDFMVLTKVHRPGPHDILHSLLSPDCFLEALTVHTTLQ